MQKNALSLQWSGPRSRALHLFDKDSSRGQRFIYLLWTSHEALRREQIYAVTQSSCAEHKARPVQSMLFTVWTRTKAAETQLYKHRGAQNIYRDSFSTIWNFKQDFAILSNRLLFQGKVVFTWYHNIYKNSIVTVVTVKMAWFISTKKNVGILDIGPYFLVTLVTRPSLVKRQ